DDGVGRRRLRRDGQRDKPEQERADDRRSVQMTAHTNARRANEGGLEERRARGDETRGRKVAPCATGVKSCADDYPALPYRKRVRRRRANSPYHSSALRSPGAGFAAFCTRSLESSPGSALQETHAEPLRVAQDRRPLRR